MAPPGPSAQTAVPSCPKGMKTIVSEVAPGAAISYKQTCICETTAGVQSFSGYIHLPSSLLEGVGGASEYNASIFFWYFESRNNLKNAPLALYLGGGPGTSSLTGTTAENRPCFVNSDSNRTTRNAWTWNNHVNILYVDQLVQVGFSYDELFLSTLDLLTLVIAPRNGSGSPNATVVGGTLPSQKPGTAANATANAARLLWKFTQIWTQKFPEHRSSDDRISIWANSYGGHWSPGAMAYFQSQNKMIRDGSTSGIDATPIHLDTLGITNGCIDSKIEIPFYLEYAVNNTYGFKSITDDIYNDARNNLTKAGGCNDLVDRCRALNRFDAEDAAANDTVNAACAELRPYCWQYVQGAYVAASGEYRIGYFNQDWVRTELGVPLNYTVSSTTIAETFLGVTRDPMKVSIDALNYVAQNGIKVALVFGDRDSRCNWLGGEAVNLAMNYSASAAFAAAGYEPITTNSTYQGGVVRQHNKVSFSRVFEAGHVVGAYEPETVSRIFDRVMFDKNVATGKASTKDGVQYSSRGPGSCFGIKNAVPPSPPN